MTAALTLTRELATSAGWTVLHDELGSSGRTWFNARRGDEVLDLVFAKAGTVKYGALFFHPVNSPTSSPRVMDVEAGGSYQIDHVDERTPAKRARVASWLTFGDVRAAQRALAE